MDREEVNEGGSEGGRRRKQLREEFKEGGSVPPDL